MNKYNKILEFDKIISILKDKVYLEKSKEELDNYVLFETLEEVKNSLDETYETSSLLQRMGRIPISITPNCDMDKIISKTTKGGILSLQELSETGNFLDTLKNNILYLDRVKNAKINCIHLEQIVNLFIYPKELNLEIKKVVTPYGELKEDASPLLKEIIKKERDTEKNIQIRLQEILHKNAAILSQQVISIRNDRYVLPVKNDYKNQLKGIIHDQSSSKETVFIEPLSILELNNTLNQYKDEEQIEINRILRSLSNEISKYSEILYNDFKNLIFLDILFSKAQYGVDIEGSLPKVNQDGIVDLLGCYHPLLQVEHVVKNNISIGKDYKGIIITGPNTGGKTVLLKTIGLLSLMVKFGLLLPCDENSNIMIFDHIYADIGDEQSIDQNLSTFSSHLMNVIEIMNNVTNNSLVLLDELGSGTDPLEGSSLAIAIFDELINKECLVVATSHYSELKIHAYQSKNIVNASVEFDIKTLKPTYRLLMGVPGMSNALDIAAILGLPNHIIEKAKNYVHQQDDSISNVLDKLVKQSTVLDEKIRIVEEERKQIIKKQNELDKSIEDSYDKRNKIIEEANIEKEKLINQSKEEIENILYDLENLKKKDVKMHEIANIKHRISSLDTPSLEKEYVLEKENLEIGDNVFVKSHQMYGNVIKKIKDDVYEVQMGIMTLRCKKSDLIIKDNNISDTINKINKNNIPIEIKKNVSSTLDLRGERYESASDKIDKFLDDAIYANLSIVSIIHGFGTGVIRKLVHDKLKNNKNIISYRYGGSGEGGQGVTIVTLKE